MNVMKQADNVITALTFGIPKYAIINTIHNILDSMLIKRNKLI